MPAPQDLEVFQIHQAARLVRELKDFAFSLSPAFQNDTIGRVDAEKSLYPRTPGSNASQTQLKLAFYAFRGLGPRSKPGYDFTVRVSSEQEIATVPDHILPELDEDVLNQLEDASDDAITESKTSTYILSQYGQQFISVTNDYTVKLFSDTVFEASTDDLHIAQQGVGVDIPLAESFEGESYFIAPLRVEHPDETIVDSTDSITDAIQKLERELALRAIFDFNNLDLARAFYDFDEITTDVRQLVYTLQTGDLKFYKAIMKRLDTVPIVAPAKDSEHRKEK